MGSDRSVLVVEPIRDGTDLREGLGPKLNRLVRRLGHSLTAQIPQELPKLPRAGMRLAVVQSFNPFLLSVRILGMGNLSRELREGRVMRVGTPEIVPPTDEINNITGKPRDEVRPTTRRDVMLRSGKDGLTDDTLTGGAG